MPDPALLDPNNRLLGWSTSDLSVYGGQPTVTLGQPRGPDAGGGYVSVPTALAPASSSASPTAASAPIVEAPSPVPAAPEAAAAMPIGGAVPPAVSLSPPAIAAGAPAPAIPDSIGAGSLAPIAITTPLAAAGESGFAGAAETAAPLTAAVLVPPTLGLAPTAPTGEAIAALANPALVAPLFDGAIGTMTGLVASAPATITTTAEIATTLLDGVVATLPVDTVEQTISGLGSGLGATAVDAVAGTAGTVAGAADALVAITADLAADTAGPAVATVVDDAAGMAVAPVADTAAAVVDDAVGTVTAPVADLAGTAFGGSDPAGGVATLVGMVESAEVFDLSAAVTATPLVAEGGSILDALAADEAPHALLGGVDHVADGLLGTDDHDQGGLLGGL